MREGAESRYRWTGERDRRSDVGRSTNGGVGLARLSSEVGQRPPEDLPAVSGLCLRDVSVRYGAKAVVANVDLHVPKGSTAVLLGASGSGKTTVIRAVAGFVPVSTGEITFDGDRLDTIRPERRRLGVVFQDYALFPHMTVKQNLGFGLSAQGIRREVRRASVDTMLERLRLGPLGDRKPDQLSGGQQQRVAIGRALICEPRVLLMDEPLAALDRVLREDLLGELRDELRSTGVTTVYVTHDQNEAFTLGDSVVILCDGRIEQKGSPGEVYDTPVSLYSARLGGDTNTIVVGAGSLDDPVNSGWWLDGRGLRLCRVSLPVAAWNGSDRVTCVVRPENLRLSPTVERSSSGCAAPVPQDGEALNCDVEIRDTVVRGSEVRYIVEVGAERLQAKQARNAGSAPFAVGQRVRLSIASAALVPTRQ